MPVMSTGTEPQTKTAAIYKRRQRGGKKVGEGLEQGAFEFGEGIHSHVTHIKT